MLSQSPAFPEVTIPVLMHLKKHSKHCKSEPLRRQLKLLIDKVETSAADVRARRSALTEAPDPKKFLLFEPDTAMGKARAEALKRRAKEERERVEAELREDSKNEKYGAPDEYGNTAVKRKKEGRKERMKKKGQHEEGAQEEAAKKKRKKNIDAAVQEVHKARDSGALAGKEDMVEKMGFSSGDE